MEPLTRWTPEHAAIMARRSLVLAMLHREVAHPEPARPENVTPISAARSTRQRRAYLDQRARIRLP